MPFSHIKIERDRIREIEIDRARERERGGERERVRGRVYTSSIISLSDKR